MRDPILRQDYPQSVQDAAEEFLIRAFDSGGTLASGEGPPSTLIAAAMHVIGGISWEQPSDEQVKAAVFEGRNPSQ